MCRSAPSSYERIADEACIASFLRDRCLACSNDLIDRGDGWTFVLNQVQWASPELRALHHQVWAHFGLPGGFNAYLTPPHAQGKETHTDPHDVFVLQQAGTKTWALFERGLHGAAPCEVTLAPGDVLYVPRGLPHHARSSGTAPSLHLAVGVHRGGFTSAGLMAAWLELEDREVHDEDPVAVLRRVDALHARLAACFSASARGNQLLPSDLSLPLLRALDSEDLPPGLHDAAASHLAGLARDLAGRLYNSDALEDVEAAARLAELCRRPPAEQAGGLVRAFFLMRECRWGKHYRIHGPKSLRGDRLGAEALLPDRLFPRLFRRCPDAAALLSRSGALLLNGRWLGELPPEALPAVRFCLGLRGGASGGGFRAADVPGAGPTARSVLRALLAYEGIEPLEP